MPLGQDTVDKKPVVWWIMEIKEEGTSEEGQHFLSTAQANDPEDIQFTSKHMCLVSHGFLKSQTVTQIFVSQTNILVHSQTLDSTKEHGIT